MATNCKCSPALHRRCNLHKITATEKLDAGAGPSTSAGDHADGPPTDHLHLGMVARRALLASKNRRGRSRKAGNKDAKSLPSRLSKMSVADDEDD